MVMKHTAYSFPVAFWGEDQSTKVTFKIAQKLPNRKGIITSVMCAVFRDHEILLVKPKRGWCLPGGHVEENESPIEAIKRECSEEAAVEIKNIKLIGYWETEKIVELETNKRYPSNGYQLLFIADLYKMHQFKSLFEVDDCRFVEPSMVAELHHNYANFKEILRYITDIRPGGDGHNVRLPIY